MKCWYWCIYKASSEPKTPLELKVNCNTPNWENRVTRFLVFLSIVAPLLLSRLLTLSFYFLLLLLIVERDELYFHSARFITFKTPSCDLDNNIGSELNVLLEWKSVHDRSILGVYSLPDQIILQHSANKFILTH